MASYSPLLNTTQYALYSNITADTLVKTGPGNLVAIIVASHTSGAVKIWDSLTAATTILVNTYTYPAAGSQTIPFYGVKFTTGLFVDVTGTQDITVVYN